MQIHNSQDTEYSTRRTEVIQMELSDKALSNVNDFEKEISKEQWGLISTTWAEWNLLGLLLKNGFIDNDMMFEFLSARGPIVHWDKYGTVIRDYRTSRKWYSYGVGFEYLAEEMRTYRAQQEKEIHNEQ